MIRPPSPYAQVLTLAVTGRGSFPSLKMVYQPTSEGEDDATLDSTCAAERVPPTSSRMTMPPDARGGGVFEQASPKTLGSWSVVRYLLRVHARGVGGGV